MNAFRMRASIAAAAAAIILCSVPAFAATFSEVAEFGEPGLGPKMAGSIKVLDNITPPWHYDITNQVHGLPGSATITSATLSIAFSGTDGNETWQLAADGVPLGALPASASVMTHEIPLPPDALAALAADGKLDVTLTESTGFRDGIRLYQATLSGSYESGRAAGGSGRSTTTSGS